MAVGLQLQIGWLAPRCAVQSASVVLSLSQAASPLFRYTIHLNLNRLRDRPKSESNPVQFS